MLLDSDTFFPSSPHPSEDTLADGLVGWDWSPDTTTTAGTSPGVVVVEDSVEAYSTHHHHPLSLFTVPNHQHHSERLSSQNTTSQSSIPQALLSSLQQTQQRPTNVVIGRATSPNLNTASGAVPPALHQSQQAPPDYTSLYTYACKYEDVSLGAPPPVSSTGAQYTSYNCPSSPCSTPSSIAVSSLVGSPSPEQKSFFDHSQQVPQLPPVDSAPPDVQNELLYLQLDSSALQSSSPPAIVTGCDASGKVLQPPQMTFSTGLHFGEEIGDGGAAAAAAGGWMLKYDTDAQVCMTQQSARRGRPKRCKGDVKRGGKSEGDMGGDGRRPGATQRTLGDVTCYRGVYFDAIRHLWRANWPEESVIIDKSTRNVIDVRRCTRTKGFSAKKFGYQEAQRMAIEHREKMTGPGMVRHYVYQQDAQVPLAPATRTAKPDMNN